MTVCDAVGVDLLRRAAKSFRLFPLARERGKAGADNGSLRAISDIDVTFAEGRAHHHHRAREPEKRGPSQRMALSR